MWDNEDEVTLRKKAHNLCKEFLDGPWQNVSLQDFKFSVVSGGLSNRLYHCALPQTESNAEKRSWVPKQVLLRIYGDFQDNTDIIVRETTIFTLLSERNLGPKLYGVFPKGRLEQYIPSRILKRIDMRKLSTAVAQEMAKIHALQVPINKKPTVMWSHMENWLEILEKHLVCPEPKENIRQVLHDNDFRNEIKWLYGQVQKTASPSVFCHNDLQGGNILLKNEALDTTSANLVLIDFEYSFYNYRGFDIANHFGEWCFEYSTKEFPFFSQDMERYPTKDEQLDYIEAYLEQLKREGAFSGDSFAMEKEKMKILDEVFILRLASHLLWMFWSFKLEINPAINFAFWEYGKTRLDLYKKQKEEFLSKGFIYIDNEENVELIV